MGWFNHQLDHLERFLKDFFCEPLLIRERDGTCNRESVDFVDLFNDQYCRCVYLIVDFCCFWWFLAKKIVSQNLIAIILRVPNLGDGFTPKYWQLFQSQLQLRPNGRVHGGLDLLRISKKRWASVAVVLQDLQFLTQPTANLYTPVN